MGPYWRVLVADDDVEICSLIQTILRRGPYTLTICNDAESALIHVQREEPFDIIICDFMLPGISGIELITQVRAIHSSDRVPIVMISGHDNLTMDARAKSAGANAFLNKPFTIKQLRSTVATLLDGRLSIASFGQL
jgi:CheY-like chemotaxis protein